MAKEKGSREKFEAPPFGAEKAIEGTKAAVHYTGGRKKATTPVEEVRDRHEGRLLRIPGVVGVGVGKTKLGDPAIKVYLSHDGPEKAIPATLDDVPVETEITGMFDAQ